MKGIIPTGGAGFIGSNLCDHFLKLGHKVICLDNLATNFVIIIHSSDSTIS